MRGKRLADTRIDGASTGRVRVPELIGGWCNLSIPLRLWRNSEAGALFLLHMRSLLILGVWLGVCAFAQPAAPWVDLRGITSDFSRLPAPADVTPGSVIHISGANFTSGDPWTATDFPAPTDLGDPPLRVLINGVKAPLLAVSATEIRCQVPVDASLGRASVVVQIGDSASATAAITINAFAPAVHSTSNDGTGAVDGLPSGSGSFLIRTMGLGPATPSLPAGSPAPSDQPSIPNGNIRVYVDGVRLNATVQGAQDRVGEFYVHGDMTAVFSPGSLLQILAEGNLSNLLTNGSLSQTDVVSLPLPSGLTDPRGLLAPDLKSAYALVNGPRGSDGCYPSWLADFGAKKTTALSGCVSIPNQNLATPFQSFVNSPVLAAFVGPLNTNLADGISSKVRVLNPGLTSPLDVTLPFGALSLRGATDGSIVASPVFDGDNAKVDVDSGNVSNVPSPGNGSGSVIPAIVLFRQVDLGNGVNQLLGFRPIPAGVLTVVADSMTTPSRAKVGLLDYSGNLISKQDFPSGWVPLLSPASPTSSSQAGSISLPGASGFPATLYYDQNSQTLFVPSSSPDGSAHAMSSFSGAALSAQSNALPGGWYFTNCTANLTAFDLKLSAGALFFGSKSLDNQYRGDCSAAGYLRLDLANLGQIQAYELANQGSVLIASSTGFFNDYLYGLDASTWSNNTSKSVYVFDAVNLTASRIDVPSSSAAFMNPISVDSMNLVIAAGQNNSAGDAGIVAFDLVAGQSRGYAIPDGFSKVDLIDIFPATKKALGRAWRKDGKGSQLLVYDLVAGGIEVVANPSGVAWVGTTPQIQVAGSSAPVTTPMLRTNPKSNSAVALGYGSDQKPAALISIRIP